MAKLPQTSTKYQIRARLTAEGVVEKPDVIGALFGQTEGLLGPELDLREIQQTGRIGRIEVTIETKNGRSSGTILVPSSLDSAETALVAAALETIDRIGPCNAKISVESVEDLRTVKRKYIVERAKKLLADLIGKMPETSSVTEQLMKSVRQAEITEYAGLPAGPDVATADSIILCEGRADVVNLLKHGVRNAIAVGGTSASSRLANLCQEKEVTVFLDGDRGGDLILKELSQLVDIDFVARAPEGKEVEELTKKEIFKALRDKVPLEQAQSVKHNGGRITSHEREEPRKPHVLSQFFRREKRLRQVERVTKRISPDKKQELREQLNELLGTRAVAIYDRQGNFSGRVPIKELQRSVGHLSEPGTLVIDGEITPDIVKLAEATGIQTVVGTQKKDTLRSRSVLLLTMDDLDA